MERSEVIGLTGGIGSGKSTVSALLAARGAYIVDADSIAREVVATGTPGLAALVEEFGPGVVAPGGGLDRGALADLAFVDPAKRIRLNEITHPLIFARTAELFADAPADAIVVHDVALLTELGLAGAYRMVIVVDCPNEVRVARLVARGLAQDDAWRRIDAQASREDRLAIADVVLKNDSDFAALERQVEDLWPHLATFRTR